MDLPAVADNDELPATFHQVVTAAANLGLELRPADLALDIADRPTDNAAARHRLGRKEIVQPGGVDGTGRRVEHAETVTLFCLRSG
jgi:hypothetical protein